MGATRRHRDDDERAAVQGLHAGPGRQMGEGHCRQSQPPHQLGSHAMNEMTMPAIKGEEHWTTNAGGAARLFMFEKCLGDPAKAKGTILFEHGSTMASQPTFDLQVPGRPDSSAMDFFARRGFDCWAGDMEGYGRSTKDRDNNAPIAMGADDCHAAALYIQKLRGKRPFLVY